ncbi:MAG: thioesterase family protein [Pseudomonadota bacterium]
MPDSPQEGTDGPYPAPLKLPGGRVRPEWIDYNDHMNVAFYVVAFDTAVDWMLENLLGIGESHVKRAHQGPYALQSSIHYLDEMLQNELFDFRALMVDADTKRMHFILEMLKADGRVTATYEQLIVNVDLTTRRSAPYPDWAQARLARMVADHAGAPRPAQFAQALGIRRRQQPA